MNIFKTTANQSAIIAGIFTLLGVVVGVSLEQWSQDRVLHKIQQRDIAKVVSARVQGRWVRASAIIQSGGSSVFPSRWDDYIERGVFPWNEDYRYMRSGLNQYFPSSVKKFDKLNISFQNLHGILLEYHRAKGTPNPKDETRAVASLDGIGKELDLLVDSLFESER